MSAKKEDLFIQAVIAQIDEARSANKQYLIYTIPASNPGGNVVEAVIVELKALGFYATHFSIPDPEPETPSAWDIYICWSETAKEDAIKRGYLFS